MTAHHLVGLVAALLYLLALVHVDLQRPGVLGAAWSRLSWFNARNVRRKHV